MRRRFFDRDMRRSLHESGVLRRSAYPVPEF
jgi:hypothetical protein